MYGSIYEIMDKAIEYGASDIHLTDRVRPIVRVDGQLYELSDFEVNDKDILAEYAEELLSEHHYDKYQEEKNIDSSFEHGEMRFRIHIYKQRGADAFSLRLIPKNIPVFSEMGLPPIIKNFINYKNGLVLVTGVTGSGKSTTLASLIGEINRTQRKHIITIEDPIEYVHEHGTSIVNQREVGTDVNNFSDAVRAAMREDPDILLVGEMRDVDTISNAITMSETGHLVLGTLHTKSVAETIDRMIDVFPPSQQEQIRVQLANSIKGVVTQELLPCVGGGRVALCEVMIPDDGLRSLIREQASPNSINDHIDLNAKKTGSISRVNGIADLLIRNRITKEVALSLITQDDAKMLKTIIGSGDKKIR